MKQIITLILLAALTFTAACTNRNNGTDAVSQAANQEEAIHTIADIFPRTPDRLKHFEGAVSILQIDEDGNEVWDEREHHIVTFQDHVHETRNQSRLFSFMGESESVVIEVYELRDGEVRLINVVPNALDRADITDIPDDEIVFEVIILQEPIVVGQEWVRNNMPGSHEVARIVSVDAEITVPAGTFTAVVVELYNEINGTVIREYYAPGMGLVYSERDSGGVRQHRALAEFLDGPFIEYLPIFKGWHFEEEEWEDEVFLIPVASVDYVQIGFPTNADVKEIYMDAFREYFSEAWNIDLGAGLVFNSIVHDMPGMTLNLDLSSEFLELADSLGIEEELLLQLTADTMGYIYGAFAVNFFIDGEEHGERVIMTLYREW